MPEVSLHYDGLYELHFDPSKHIYKLVKPIEFAGKKLSATGITDVINKPALINWAVNTAADYLRANLKPGTMMTETEIEALADSMRRYWRSVSKKAAGIGILTHRYAEQFGHWKLGVGPEPERPFEAAANRGIDAFHSWLDAHHVKFLHCERKVYSREHDYCGTVDLIAEVDSRLVVADFKTSAAVYKEYSLQINGAYRMAIDEENFLGRPLDGALCLRFDKESGEFESHALESYESDREAFLACLKVKRWQAAK